MKKRILSLLLVLVMVLGMFPGSAMATGSDKVYASVSYDGAYLNLTEGVMAYREVALSDLAAIDLTEYGLSDYLYDEDSDGDYEVTALHLLIYTHETLMGLSWDDVRVSGSAGSIFFEGGLFGFDDCNLQYYLNGDYPAIDGWGVTADQIVLKNGDFIDAAGYSSWSFYSDSAFGFHYFLDSSEEITHEYTATAGETLTVTLGRGASYMGDESGSMTKVADYTVSYGSTFGTATGTVTTGGDGTTEITFTEAGIYYLWVDGGYGNENPLDIVSAPGYAKVTVTAPACAHSWSEATCTTPKTCSECGDTEGEADPEAHSYVDGSCEYCGAAEPGVDPYGVSVTVKGAEQPVCRTGLFYPDTDRPIYFAELTAAGEYVLTDELTGSKNQIRALPISISSNIDINGPVAIHPTTYSITKAQVEEMLGASIDGLDDDDKLLNVIRVRHDSTFYILVIESPLVHPTGITLDWTELTLEGGTTTKLNATFAPEGADATITWTSSNNVIASVAADGTVKGKKAGTAVITATAENLTATCTVTVTGDYIEPTLIVDAGTGWSSIDWPYAGCNINKVAVNNVWVDGFTVNGSNYYITLDSDVADDAAVELGIGTNLQYSNLWVLANGVSLTESPISTSTDLTYTVTLENGTATLKLGGSPGYNTGSYIEQYAVSKTFYFSTSGKFPVAPIISGGNSTSALRVENDTWSADLSALFTNNSDKEVTYKVAIDGAEAVECAADYTYTCDAPGTRKLVFTAVNDYGTSPSYTATISVLPTEAVKEANHAVLGGTITWFAFTDDQLNALPEGTTYEWDAETTTWTIIQPADINITGKVITYYNLVKDDPAAKLPLLTGSNQTAGASTMWDAAVRNQQTNTLTNGAVNAYVYLYETDPRSGQGNNYTTIRFNYDRQKPDTYFEYKVDGNAELTIAGDVGGVNGHQWTGDREVHVALNDTTPVDAIISCVEAGKTVTLSDGVGQFSYTTGSWPYEQTWTIKYKIDRFPTLIDSEKTSEDVTIPALETYTLDLTTIFTDPDEGDTLSYQVKLNDGSWTNVEGSQYSYTPETAQDYVLTFRAYDGFVGYTDTYTVNMTATNATETYTVTVTAPENVLFYCTAEFVDGVDVPGTPVEASYAEGVYTLSVPANASQISWRMGEVGMSAAVEADTALMLIEANFKIMAGEAEDTGALTVKYGDYVAVGSENSYLLLDGAEYSYAVTPADTRYRAYSADAQTPADGENVIKLTLKHITVIAPEGSTISSGRFYSYFRYDFSEAYQTTTLDDGRISVDFSVPGSESFIRVQHPDGVTYWDFERNGFSDGTTLEVTADMLFIGSDEYTKDTVYANFEKNNKDKADLYLTVNAQGWLDMDGGDVHSLNVFRNWIPVANSISNNGVSLPDVTYTVVDVNGNASDVVEVVPDANNSCYADIKAVKAGTAIILVSYDAVYNADGEGGKQFSAIWPENTGVIVVTVDAEDANIQTNITVNEEANASGKQILDVEHDILFYVGDGAAYSFKPEDGCTVTVARSAVGDEMSFNGFTNQGITVTEDGTVTISGLTTGTHIIKVEKDGKAAYQVIRAREVSYLLKHSDGTEVTTDNPAQPGETVTVQFSRLVDPLAKLSGVYNANFGFYYNGEDGAAVRTSGGTYGVYDFSGNAARQKFTVAVPAEWNAQTYTLTDGGIKLGGFGGSFGSHRSKSYLEGAQVNTNASGTAGVASVLPDVVIPVYTENTSTTYTVTLPAEPVGYTVTASGESASPVTDGGSYSFTVTIADGYEKTESFAVKANGTALTAVEGVYTIENITADQTITIEGVVEKAEEPALTWQEVMAKTQAHLTAQAENIAPIVGSTKGEWMVIGLARNGMNADDDIFDGYYDNVVRFVEEKYDADTGRLDKNQATVNARVILGLTSIGKDVTDVAGHNLLKGLSDTDFVKKQGINGPVWTLIALDSHDYEIPTNSDSSKQVTRQWLIDYILDNQLEGGGWKISGTSPDDMTPMAVQALAPYYNSNAEVKAAIDKALTIMEGMVENASPETLAQIIVARSAMGLDSEEILNKMLAFALEDGSFKKAPSATSANQMSTEQAFYAMVAYSRFLGEKNFLYDMSDVTIEEPAQQDKPVERVALSDSTLSLKVGESEALVALVSPADATNRTVTWRSSNTGVAAVSSNGVVSAIAEGSAILTATAGGKSDSCIVTVTKASSSKLEFGLTEDEIIGYVTVSFEDRGVRKSEELSEIDAEFRSPLGTIISATRVPFKEGDTIASVTLRLLDEKGFTASYQGNEFSGFYLEAIGSFTARGNYYSSFGEFDAGRDSGWMITWDGWFINQGASEFEVEDGNVIRWQYTCQLGADIGDVDWSDNNSANNNPSSEDRAAAREVKSLIEAIGTVTKNSGKAIEAARKAYDALTDTQKELVPNYDELVAAEKKYAELTGKLIFTDVSESDYYYEAVKWAVELGITNGTSATTFSPNASCTRAQMVTFLWRAAGSPKAASTTFVFTDVDKAAYYYEALLWAVETGITNGTSATTFSPNATCTRGQMATFLYRSAKTPVVTGAHSFTDVKANDYYNEAVVWAAAEGITNGTSATTFSPDADCTRGQMVTFLYRYLAK